MLYVQIGAVGVANLAKTSDVVVLDLNNTNADTAAVIDGL